MQILANNIWSVSRVRAGLGVEDGGCASAVRRSRRISTQCGQLVRATIWSKHHEPTLPVRRTWLYSTLRHKLCSYSRGDSRKYSVYNSQESHPATINYDLLLVATCFYKTKTCLSSNPKLWWWTPSRCRLRLRDHHQPVGSCDHDQPVGSCGTNTVIEFHSQWLALTSEWNTRDKCVFFRTYIICILHVWVRCPVWWIVNRHRVFRIFLPYSLVGNVIQSLLIHRWNN